MKAITYTKKNTATIILAYLALVLTLAVLFTSCSVARREGDTSPCNKPGATSGYAKDSQGRHVNMVNRRSY